MLGRTCQVYRTGQPLESFGTTAPTDTDYTDACIDERRAHARGGLGPERGAGRADHRHRRRRGTQPRSPMPRSPSPVTRRPSPMAAPSSTRSTPPPCPCPATSSSTRRPTATRSRVATCCATPPTRQPSTDGTTTTTVAGQAPTIVDSYVDVYVAGRQDHRDHAGPDGGGARLADHRRHQRRRGTLGSTDGRGRSHRQHPRGPSGHPGGLVRARVRDGAVGDGAAGGPVPSRMTSSGCVGKGV